MSSFRPQRTTHATPQQKPAIIDLIQETADEIAQAEGELPALQDALEACLPNIQDVDVSHDLHPISG